MDKRLRQAGELCFWAGLILELLITMIDISIDTWAPKLFALTFLLFLVKAALSQYTMKEWICIAAIGLTAVTSYFISGREEVLRAAALIVACKDIPLDKILKTTLGIMLAGCIVLFVLSAAGISGQFSMTADFGRGETANPLIETRYCFGMRHPNVFHGMLLVMSSIALYLWHDKMHIFHFLLLMGINSLAFIFTESRTSFCIITALLAGTFALKYCRCLREHKLIYLLTAALLIILVLFSAYGSHIGIGTAFLYQLDKLLNGRFQCAYEIENARIENWQLFADASNKAYFDQGWIRLFYRYGWIPGIAYIAGSLYLIYKGYYAKDYTLTVIVAAYSVFSVMETLLISNHLLCNPLFLWFGYYWNRSFEAKGTCEYSFWQLPEILLSKN